MKSYIQKSVIVLGAVALLVGSVPFASAADATSTSGASCSRIGDFSVNTQARLTDRESRYAKNYSDRLSNVDSREQKQNDRLVAARTKQDEGRIEQYGKLEGRAKTDAQKAAVIAYESAINSAKATRRAAVDAAVSTFRTSLDSAIASRKSQVDASLNTFKTSVNAALEKAKADCTSGVDMKTVRATLKSSLDAARTKLESDRKAIDKLGDVVSPLAKTRNAAVDAAVKNFKTAADAAKAALVAAFK
jgi:hypothetical protein